MRREGVCVIGGEGRKVVRWGAGWDTVEERKGEVKEVEEVKRVSGGGEQRGEEVE